jgi:hypothetical protein
MYIELNSQNLQLIYSEFLFIYRITNSSKNEQPNLDLNYQIQVHPQCLTILVALTITVVF